MSPTLASAGRKVLMRHRVGGLAHADDVAADLVDLAVQRFLEVFAA
jgi:hypothetical protein